MVSFRRHASDTANVCGHSASMVYDEATHVGNATHRIHCRVEALSLKKLLRRELNEGLAWFNLLPPSAPWPWLRSAALRAYRLPSSDEKPQRRGRESKAFKLKSLKSLQAETTVRASETPGTPLKHRAISHLKRKSGPAPSGAPKA